MNSSIPPKRRSATPPPSGERLGAPCGARGEVDSGYAWYRLVVGLVLSTIGGVGMWAVVVALPRCRPSSAWRAPTRRCRTR